MSDELATIGFYTLSDGRAARSSLHTPLWRCELLITDACNFRCPYCRGCKDEYRGTLRRSEWEPVLRAWTNEGLRNVRFSGGEPTLHSELPAMIEFCRERGVERIAISTNGSRPLRVYDELLWAGVNDFSVSLDACCAATGDAMAGGIPGAWSHVTETIRFLARRAYVTVGVVLTADNAAEMAKTVQLAHDLGVADIRIISAAQEAVTVPAAALPAALCAAHPILRYRVRNLLAGRPMRGLRPSDHNRCPLALDDMAVVGGHHFPCIIYLREGGAPIGRVAGPRAMREERARWAAEHDTHADPICRANCLDVCVDFNNRWRDLRAEAARQRRLRYANKLDSKGFDHGGGI